MQTYQKIEKQGRKITNIETFVMNSANMGNMLTRQEGDLVKRAMNNADKIRYYNDKSTNEIANYTNSGFPISMLLKIEYYDCMITSLQIENRIINDILRGRCQNILERGYVLTINKPKA